MPVDRIYTSEDAVWGYWLILEDEESLAAEVPREKPADALTNPLKRLEFLAARTLVKTLLNNWGEVFQGMKKDAFGKPFLVGSEFQISLSHSYPYVAAIIHRHKNVGIDLEQPKPKLLRVGPRILAPGELQDAGDNVTKHCVYWCAKETLIKIYGKKDLIFARNLLVQPFTLGSHGHIIGRILANNTETAIPLEYLVSENFVVVVSS
jgi:4'-phosphopantetheinyl transferase EntD